MMNFSDETVMPDHKKLTLEIMQFIEQTEKNDFLDKGHLERTIQDALWLYGECAKSYGYQDGYKDANRKQRWGLIESAPMDGTAILVCRYDKPSGPAIRSARFKRSNWVSGFSSNSILYSPTHWMPLPNPPEPNNDTETR